MRRFVSAVDPGEVFQISAPRLCIQPLHVAPLAFLQRRVDQDLDKIAVTQQAARQFAAFFESHDVYITPTLGQPPLKVGTIDFMPETSKGGADGEAYRLSGPALDGMGTKQTLCLALSQRWGGARQDPEALKTTVVLVGALADRWTEKQALAVKGALLGYTQEETRKIWPSSVTRQAVAKSLDGAGWFAVERALRLFEALEFQPSY